MFLESLWDAQASIGLVLKTSSTPSGQQCSHQLLSPSWGCRGNAWFTLRSPVICPATSPVCSCLKWRCPHKQVVQDIIRSFLITQLSNQKQIRRIVVPRLATTLTLKKVNVKVKVTAWCQLKGLVTRIMHAKYQCSIINTSEDMSQVKVFSAPEPKAQVHYCDHALSVVRRPASVRRPSVRR